VYTVGHSTRSLEELIALLAEHGVKHLVDVRRHPASRRHPHFAKAALERGLAEAAIGYRHSPELGGLRKPSADSPNTAWKNASFRAYADHQQTAEFQTALEALLAEACRAPTAIMCAEAVPWRCHRQIIADALVSRDVAVRHILGASSEREHTINPHAQRQADGTLVYM
jgi:uncharacterized protein (DUF488 family)